MSIWKEKILPKFKKVFDMNGTKKAAAAESTKAFDEAKEQYSKDFDEKKSELQPKVLEIYEAASTQLKALIKEPKEAGLKKQSTAVKKFLDGLVKIEFPGSKEASEAATKFGPVLASGPITFVFEKVSTLIPVVEEKKEEAPASAETTGTAAAPAEETSGAATTTEVKEKEIAIEGEKKKEEVVVGEAAPATDKTEAPPATEAAAAETPKA